MHDGLSLKAQDSACSVQIDPSLTASSLLSLRCSSCMPHAPCCNSSLLSFWLCSLHISLSILDLKQRRQHHAMSMCRIDTCLKDTVLRLNMCRNRRGLNRTSSFQSSCTISTHVACGSATTIIQSSVPQTRRQLLVTCISSTALGKHRSWSHWQPVCVCHNLVLAATMASRLTTGQLLQPSGLTQRA
jgi:hypothetical protein